MAITAADYIQIMGPSVGARTPFMHATRDTSIAFKRGDPAAVASGKATNASASHVVANTFAGFAANPETASTGTTCQIVPARPGLRFKAKINTASSSSKLLQTHWLARAALKRYTSSSANVWTVDPNLSSSSSTFKVALITRLIDAASTVNGWVECEIASQNPNGASTATWALW